MRKLAIMAAALLAAAGSVQATIGDSPEQFSKRFAARVDSSTVGGVTLLRIDNGHWRTSAFVLNGSVETECFEAMTPTTASDENVRYQINRCIGLYTGKGRYAKNWSRYSLKGGGVGWSRSDGLLFIEVTTSENGMPVINIASLIGYRWLMNSGNTTRPQQDEAPADQQRQQRATTQKSPDLYKL
ncbi:MAG TPA: hypothetical protein VFU37_09480 [Pyrinomonadaceae bacterium]|jgi:hypothetical protein|nr:hypothetical protein [Pyrinomonadaceae bacterium]